MNKYTPILLTLCLLALIMPVSATIQTFETGLEGWTGSRVTQDGNNVWLPAQGTVSTQSRTISGSYTVQFDLFIPNGYTSEYMAFQIFSGSKMYGIQQRNTWYIYQNGAYSNTNVSVTYGSWIKLKGVYSNNMVSWYANSTLIYSNSVGTNNTTPAQLLFSRGNDVSSYYVDNIQDTNNMPLVFHVIGNGSFYPVKNSIDQPEAYPGHDVTVNYSIGDRIGWYVVAYTGNHFVSIYDDPYTETSTVPSLDQYVIGQIPNRMIAVFAVDQPTPTPTPSPSPTPVITPNSTINYNIGALINNGNLDVHACAGSARGYFYMTAPNNQHKYATYVNEYSCTDFSIPIADMIASGGAGNWTLSIFDESDMSQSKAYYQILISDGMVLLFTSNPSGASVYVNSSFKGITPFNLNAGNQTNFHFRFNKSGYVDAIFDSHLTTSTTVNANLNQLPGSTPNQPVITPPDGVYDPNNIQMGINGLGDLTTTLLDALSPGTKMIIAIVILVGFGYSMGMAGVIIGLVIDALIMLPLWLTVLGGVITICYFIFGRGGNNGE